MANALQRCLKANWGHENFRPHQLEVRTDCLQQCLTKPDPYFHINQQRFFRLTVAGYAHGLDLGYLCHWETRSPLLFGL